MKAEGVDNEESNSEIFSRKRRYVTEQPTMDNNVEEQYKTLTSNIHITADLLCGWAKPPSRHEVT